MGALKDMIVDGVVLPALLRAGRWKGPMRFKATPTSTGHSSRSPIPIRKSMQNRQFQTPPAVRAPFVAPASATRGWFPSRLACGGWRRAPTSPARLRVLGNRPGNLMADNSNSHGARKSLGALTGPSRLDGALETLASRAETLSSPAPPTSRPTPRVPALAASLLRRQGRAPRAARPNPRGVCARRPVRPATGSRAERHLGQQRRTGTGKPIGF